MKSRAALIAAFACSLLILVAAPKQRPNILFIMTDDHAAQAMSCYGSLINQTPHMDRIANEGMRFDRCFVVNSICTPSRATILTGKYSHLNGVPVSFVDMVRRSSEQPHFGLYFLPVSKV